MALTTPAWGWLGLMPALILFIAINYFTGIPPNEEQNLRSRPDYAQYQIEVSSFFPWFPRRG